MVSYLRRIDKTFHGGNLKDLTMTNKYTQFRSSSVIVSKSEGGRKIHFEKDYILIMSTIKISDLKSFSMIFDQIKESNFSYNIDASSFPFFEPKHILMLVEYFVLQNFNNIDGELHVNPEIEWYIDAIGFERFCNTNFLHPSEQGRTIRNAIPIRRIDTTTMNNYIDVALKFFNRFCIGKDTDILGICISEIINNVHDHSQSKHDAYIFSQHYAKTNMIRFAISDLGVGIPTTVNNYLENSGMSALPNLEALKWATEKGKTIKSSNRNMGMGLDNIITSLREIGTLEIFTEDTYCVLGDDGILRFSLNPIRNFIGTLIAIDININKLDIFDETILDGFTF